MRSVAKENEKIVLVGLNEIFEVFENIEAINIRARNKYIRYFISKFIEPAFELLANKKIISSYNQIRKNIDGYSLAMSDYQYNKGLVKTIRYVYRGHFQSEKFFDKKIAHNLQIKKIYMDKANGFLSSIPGNRYKIFIHIRRGDYLNWSVLGENPTLPISYFDKQVEWFRNNRKSCFFIFSSDDPYFVKREFSHVKNKKISMNNSVYMDLAIMSMCEGSIISNSSLPWWGAYLMKNRDIVLSPKYWLGFKSKRWFPEGIKLSFAEIIEVER